MTAGTSDSSSERTHTELAGHTVLGIACVLAGVGMFYGLVVDSMQIVNGALVAIVVLLAVWLIVFIRTEPVVSGENAVIAICVFTAMGLYLLLGTFTALPFAVLAGVLLGVGVILPGLLLQYSSSIVN